MKAVLVSRPGGPEVLTWQEVPDPVLAPGDLLLDVVAAGVNRADLLQRRGRYPSPPGAPPWPGLECAGYVAAVGAGVTSGAWAVGDRVCALLSGGGYATRVAAPSEQVLAVPEPLELESAAALPEAACTVWSNLVMTARLRPGETVLLHGGASGIGTTAIQIAHALGARVLITAGTAAKRNGCLALGADLALDYTQDWAAAAMDATNGRGVDVVLDIVGGAYLTRNVAVLADGGRLVVIATQMGASGELDLLTLMRKRASVTGTTLRSRPAAEKSAIVAEVAEHVWPMIREGRLRPVVQATFPMDDAEQAHRALEAGEHLGKFVLTTGIPAPPGGGDQSASRQG